MSKNLNKLKLTTIYKITNLLYNMKEGVLHFMYFTKGDFVRTPEGVGIVTEDEGVITVEYDFCTSEVKIQHKESSSNNTSNKPIDIIRDYIIPIAEEEYQNSELISIH